MDRLKIRTYSVLLLIMLPAFLMLHSGCSVGMAAMGKEPMNTSIVYPGVPRPAVLARLGKPETSIKDEEGNYIDSYIIVKGNEPSTGRAVVHGTLDVLSLGLWEIVGTPFEMIEGVETKSSLIIYYDSEERIKEIVSTDPKLQKETEFEKNEEDAVSDGTEKKKDFVNSTEE